jgi:hypothetical protein
VVGSRLDQNLRAGTLDAATGAKVQKHLDQAEKLDKNPAAARSVQAQLDAAIKALRGKQGQELLVADLQELRAKVG